MSVEVSISNRLKMKIQKSGKVRNMFSLYTENREKQFGPFIVHDFFSINSNKTGEMCQLI